MPKDHVLEQLYQIAEGQDGYFTTFQAAYLGIDHKAINKAAYRGRIERSSRGVYRLIRFPIYSERAHLWEAVLWPQAHTNVRAVLSHQTALTLHGLSDTNPIQIHITVPRTFRLRRHTPQWLDVHRGDLDETEYEHVDALPVTTVERTLRDIALNCSPTILHDALRDAKRKGIAIPSELNYPNV